MDLAAIRKKAKGREKVSPASQEVKVTATPANPAAALPTAAAALPELPSNPTIAVLPLRNALDELFNGPLAGDLGSEESYLEALRQPVADEMRNQRQLLSFSLGSEDYALDIECIREIIKPREVTDIPRVPEFILGIISLRGIIIPVYDLKQRLKLGKTEISPASRIVVSQHGERVVGLLVDSISQVIRLPVQNIEPPPAVLSGLDRDMVEGVGRVQGRMMILLHLSCVVDAELV